MRTRRRWLRDQSRLPPRCGCLIWPAKELSVSAVPARAWVFLRQRRSRRELSLSNTKAANLRPSRPKTNIRTGAEITYNYGRDYLTNVITRRGCKCDKCRKKRADARAKAGGKSRQAHDPDA